MGARMAGWIWLSALGMVVASAAGAGELPEIRQAGYRAMLAERTDDVRVHRYDGNADVLVFDMATLVGQGEMFNRVVALIERIGAPRDRVLTNDELADFIRSIGQTSLTFAFGNDFRVSELVMFFNLADHGGIALNAEETRLKQFLLANGLMKLQYGFLQVNGRDRVILSMPQEQVQPLAEGRSLRITSLARETILRHELSHGEFYANPIYADYCRRFWHTVMAEPDRQAFRQFLGGRSYDTRNEEMMVNESQAYLMHTPDPNAFNPQRVGLTQARIDELRRRFIDGNPPTALFAER